MEKRKQESGFEKQVLVFSIQRSSDAGPGFGSSLLENLIAFGRGNVIPVETHARVKKTVRKVVRIIVVSVPPPDAQVEPLVMLISFKVLGHRGCHDFDFDSEFRPRGKQSSQQRSVTVLEQRM